MFEISCKFYNKVLPNMAVKVEIVIRNIKSRLVLLVIILLLFLLITMGIYL